MQSGLRPHHQRCPHCTQSGLNTLSGFQQHVNFCHFKLLNTARQHAVGPVAEDAKITMKMRDQLIHTMIDEYGMIREELSKLRAEVAHLRRVRVGTNSSAFKRCLAGLPTNYTMTQWFANIRVSNAHISRVLEGHIQDGIINWLISGIKSTPDDHPFASFELRPNAIYAYLPSNPHDKTSPSEWTLLTGKKFEPYVRQIIQKFLSKFNQVLVNEQNPKRYEALMEHASKFFARPASLTFNYCAGIIRLVREHTLRNFSEQEPETDDDNDNDNDNDD